MRAAVARAHALIRIDAAWFAVEPLDMRAGVDKSLARVVDVLGEARAHHAYLFINKRANRMKVLVHDGFGLWLCARKLYEGGFIRAGVRHERGMPLSTKIANAIPEGPHAPYHRGISQGLNGDGQNAIRNVRANLDHCRLFPSASDRVLNCEQLIGLISDPVTFRNNVINQIRQQRGAVGLPAIDEVFD